MDRKCTRDTHRFLSKATTKIRLDLRPALVPFSAYSRLPYTLPTRLRTFDSFPPPGHKVLLFLFYSPPYNHCGGGINISSSYDQ